MKDENRQAQFLVSVQEGTVREYHQRFERLLGPLKDIFNPVLESKFVSELKKEMRMFEVGGLKKKDEDGPTR